MKEFSKFSLIVFFVCGLSFIIHISVLHFLDFEMFANRIILAYSGNYVLAIGILFGLMNAPERFKNSLGYLFMLGSVFKFIFFFLFFYPYFLEDGDISRVEFFTFFIPYSVSLISETKLLINRLSED
ncbi:MAG: hypothetical protein ACPGEG_07020 [Salibacteraceae bacterium]